MYVQGKNTKIINSYLRYLIEHGPAPDFPSDERERRKAFSVILRYVASYYLRWTPLELYNHLTFEIAETYKLNALISKLGLRKAESLGYSSLVIEAYPQERFPREQQIVITMYGDIVAGRANKWPTSFFAGQNETGRQLARELVRYVISKHFPYSDVESLYAAFAENGKMSEQFKRLRIYDCYKQFWNTTLDCLHDSIEDERRCPALYSYYSFTRAYESVIRRKQDARSRKRKRATLAPTTQAAISSN